VNESELTEAEQYERWAEAEMRALRERLATERALRAAAELRADRAERELRARGIVPPWLRDDDEVMF
jgi:uncharacterized protein (DUF2267 family)